MSINACTINKQTINAACRVYPLLSLSTDTYMVFLEEGQTYGPVSIATFFNGPILSTSIIAGVLNGPGGTLQFTTDPGASGSIYFGGSASLVTGTYAGAVKFQGSFNYQTINFIVQIVPAVTTENGGQQQHVHPDTKVPLNIFKRERSEEEPYVFEQSYVQVSIEVEGQVFAQTIEQDNDFSPMVVITAMKVGEPVEEQVNIENVKTRIL